MNAEQMLLEVIREAVDTLPEYGSDGLDDDQACDVAWVRGRLADALVIVEADYQACAVHREAA